MKKPAPASLSIALGGLAASAPASACCILPLVLALAGISGAWIGNLTTLSPYQPYFIGLAAISITLGFWRLRRGEASCLPGAIALVRRNNWGADRTARRRPTLLSLAEPPPGCLPTAITSCKII
jgi:hypothetical protein